MHLVNAAAKKCESDITLKKSLAFVFNPFDLLEEIWKDGCTVFCMLEDLKVVSKMPMFGNQQANNMDIFS